MGWKCYNCFTVVYELEEDVNCPVCHTKILLKEMCEYDTGRCKCALDIHAGVHLCPKCNEPMCPECLSHDVVGISRVTGYLSDVSGWRQSKRAELKDRKRYDINVI